MKSFLEHVAEDIVRRFGEQGTDNIRMTDVAVVFPNKRASLFLNQYLYRAAGNRPVWCPQCLTIAELFHSQSKLTTADPILANCVLYDVYSRHMRQQGETAEGGRAVETLDRFWSWGETIIADFDDIDKHLGNAAQIYQNVRDLEQLTAQPEEYLTETQARAVEEFFNIVINCNDGERVSQLKRNFMMLWNSLHDIYVDFNAALLQRGLAYEGALCREVAERATGLQWRCKKYLFVGFNMVQECERQLFKSMMDQGLALFYWDYDHYYADKEAGRFINKELTARFPNALPQRDDIYNNFRRSDSDGTPIKKDVTYLSASTENIQSRYIADWLTEEGKNRLGQDQRTAIVLCDESLLKNVVHSLPDAVAAKANITVGFPLALSPVASLVKNFLTLHREGTDLRRVSSILRHPYAAFLSTKAKELLERLHQDKVFYPTAADLCDSSQPDNLDLMLAHCDANGAERIEQLTNRMCKALQLIAQECEHRRELRLAIDGGGTDSDESTYEEQFMQESLFRMHGVMTRLHDLAAGDDEGGAMLDIDMGTLVRLVDQVVKSTTMPFHGEPAVNLQIMGVLETRNLDFDHVLMLSCNEGNMPKGVNDTSLIPYIIRKAHGLTTPDSKAAIYAYHFYRLLQRCDDVSIAYNSSTEDGHTGQKSRFMIQMMVENDHMNLRQVMLTARQQPEMGRSHEVRKEGRVKAALDKVHSLSPSVINKYLRCPLLFYYEKLAGLKESHEEDTVDPRQFGSIFHAAAENMYRNIMTDDGKITTEAVKRLLSKEGEATVYRCIDDAFRDVFFNGRRPRYDGMHAINREVINRLIHQLLKADLELAPFSIVGLEQNAYEDVTIKMNDGKQRHMQIGGTIDRLDCVATDGGQRVLRVVDYKTGHEKPEMREDVASLFDPKYIDKHTDYLLQTMLYSAIVRHNDTKRTALIRGEQTAIQALNPEGLGVRPALLFIQLPESVKDPVLKFGKKGAVRSVDDIATYEEEFRERLHKLIAEIFDETVPFAPTPHTKRCEGCAFKGLCKH